MEADSRRPLHYASSVMLLDCAKLRHWRWEEDFEKTFRGERDYRDWMWLLLEPPGSVAPLEPEWNDFDRLTPETRLLHNTHRRTQPWKTGLPSDFTARGTTLSSRAGIWLRRLRGKGAGRYKRHPDPAQERLFFTLLGECLANGTVPAALLEKEIARGPHPHRAPCLRSRQAQARCGAYPALPASEGPGSDRRRVDARDGACPLASASAAPGPPPKGRRPARRAAAGRDRAPRRRGRGRPGCRGRAASASRRALGRGAPARAEPPAPVGLGRQGERRHRRPVSRPRSASRRCRR
jgi:hypothetical protein